MKGEHYEEGLFASRFSESDGCCCAGRSGGRLWPGDGAHERVCRCEHDGTYTVTANVYVDKADTPIGKNAYVTNSGNPPRDKPTSPVYNNATLVIKDGKKLLTVPIVNDTFGILSIADTSTDGVVSVVGTTETAWKAPFPWTAPYANRIATITFDVTNFAAGTSVATFSPSKEFATFPLYRGDKAWNLHFVADLSAAQ